MIPYHTPQKVRTQHTVVRPDVLFPSQVLMQSTATIAASSVTQRAFAMQDEESGLDWAIRFGAGFSALASRSRRHRAQRGSGRGRAGGRSERWCGELQL